MKVKFIYLIIVLLILVLSIYFKKCINDRYTLGDNVNFAVDIDNKFKVYYFEIVTDTYPYKEYFNPCQMEEKYLKKRYVC